MSLWRFNARPRPAGVLVALALFAAVLFATPFLHHDLSCHLKTPEHCTACVASPLASRIETGIDWTATPLRRAGRVELPSRDAAVSVVPPLSIGRSPPA